MPAACTRICTSSSTGSPTSISSTRNGELSSHSRAPLVFMKRDHRTRYKTRVNRQSDLGRCLVRCHHRSAKSGSGTLIHSLRDTSRISGEAVGAPRQRVAMKTSAEPFIGTEAVASGWISRRQLARRYAAVYRNVYLDKEVELTAVARAKAAWLWADREATLAGLSASAMH